jgi:Methylase involved in ubiquinone/menaquinone biosynthesis
MDRQAVRTAWDEVSETYARNRDPNGSDADLIDELLDRLGPAPRVLDAGCGDGARTLANLTDTSVGIDISREGLELAAETLPNGGLVEADMVSVPVAGDAVDAVTAYHSVFHVPREEQPAVYEEFARITQPGGWLLMTLPGGRYETVRRGWMGGRMLFSTPGREQTLTQLDAAGYGEIETTTATDPLGSSTEFVFAQLA